MKTSKDRILTTHVGSIPRPENIKAMLRGRLEGKAFDEVAFEATVRQEVREVVRKQADCGIDIVCDGEYGKTHFFGYANSRLGGFSELELDSNAQELANSWRAMLDTRREWSQFRDYYAEYLPKAMPPAMRKIECSGPITYIGQRVLQTDLTALRDAMVGSGATEAFVPAAAPSLIWGNANRHYKTEEAYRYAIADALAVEYKAIADAGFVVQIDDPAMAQGWDAINPAPTPAEYRALQARNVEILNHALASIPQEQVRFHLCWGSWQGPHMHDIPLKEIVEPLLAIKAQGFSIEAATPRHSWEWSLWKEVKLPEDRVLIPGVIAHTTAVVEHPETVAERIVTFANVVGRERVIASIDCGFAQGAFYQRQHPSIVWAKFNALAEGATLASKKLW